VDSSPYFLAGDRAFLYYESSARNSRNTPVKTLLIILQITLWSSAPPAQSQETKQVRDTTHLSKSVIILDPGLALGKFTVLIPPALQPGGGMMPPSFTDIRSGLESPLLLGSEQKADLISPFLLQRQKQSALSPIYTVLGAMELGGAAYIAYRHIKKYGLR
jgi:hypothetical protein